jgi:Dolichyl-phosphate-mannose-protein mannosyltransferase
MDYGLTPPTSEEASSLAVARRGNQHRQSRSLRMRIPAALPLLAVLIVQAVLSLRLLRADTAFQDEALYLLAGHLEWAHWLHGAPIPPFPAYFSGAPAIYPPLAAVADNLGGLAAARALSLAFMLGATTMLWASTARLFGVRAAFFAAALFAALGPSLHLGAFATYDAMSVFLIAVAAWLVVRAGDRQNVTSWLVAAGVVLALANVAAYSSVLFDVAVILLALLIALPVLGVRAAARRCLTVLVVVVVLLTAGLLIGGSSYVHGVAATTVARAPGGASATAVLADAWSWTGVVVVAALCGIVISWMRREPGPRTWLLAVLTLAALLGPLEQAHLHTAASLDKHVGLGAWFAAIAAGYAVDKVIAAAPAGRTRAVTCAALVIALTLPVSVGVSQSRVFSENWPNATPFIAILGPLVDHGTGHLLVEDPSIPEYYLHAESQWMRWSSTRNIVLPGGVSSGGPSSTAGIVGPGNAGTFAVKIGEHYFSLVALNFIDTTSLDHQITADLKRNGHYCVLQVVPYGIEIPPIGVGTYVIWRYEPHFARANQSDDWNCR